MAITKRSEQEMLAATFRLGQAVFGVNTAYIQEVVRVGDITPVRHAPGYVVGIRNLRGRIVTIMDLRSRLELGRVEPSPENRILIAEGQGEPIGLLVDQVEDTVTIRGADIQPAPPNVHGIQGRNLLGVCRGGGRLVALLDLTTVLQTGAEAANVASTEKSSK